MGRSAEALRLRGSHEEKPGATVFEFGGSLRRRRTARGCSRSLGIRFEICAARRAADHRHQQADTAAPAGFKLSLAQAPLEPATWQAAAPHHAITRAGFVKSSLHPQTQGRASRSTRDARSCFKSYL